MHSNVNKCICRFIGNSFVVCSGGEKSNNSVTGTNIECWIRSWRFNRIVPFFLLGSLCNCLFLFRIRFSCVQLHRRSIIIIKQQHTNIHSCMVYEHFERSAIWFSTNSNGICHFDQVQILVYSREVNGTCCDFSAWVCLLLFFVRFYLFFIQIRYSVYIFVHSPLLLVSLVRYYYVFFFSLFRYVLFISLSLTYVEFFFWRF